MSPAFSDILDAVPGFALVFARIGSVVAVLPGLGESVAPSVAKIGIALCTTLLLIPSLDTSALSGDGNGLRFLLMCMTEVVTGIWFGLIARLVVLALPVAGQVIGYLIGLSSVLQPDPEIGSQTSAIGRLFELFAPLLVLTSGLYKLPLNALAGLFVVVPPGHLLPIGDSLKMTVWHVATTFDLAVQLASPFIVVSVIWQIAMGQVARAVARMQIYFISLPGQILSGIAVLAVTAHALISAWHDRAEALMFALPGSH